MMALQATMMALARLDLLAWYAVRVGRVRDRMIVCPNQTILYKYTHMQTHSR
jgi:hypothetical protein